MKEEKKNKIIIYDGFCVLCSWSLQLIIKNDKKNIFQFISLNTKQAQEYIRNSTNTISLDKSVVLIDSKKIYTKSDAIFRILKELSFPWCFFYYFIYTPRFIRDGIYDIIANNRYSWFGKRKSCYIVPKD